MFNKFTVKCEYKRIIGLTDYSIVSIMDIEASAAR